MDLDAYINEGCPECGRKMSREGEEEIVGRTHGVEG